MKYFMLAVFCTSSCATARLQDRPGWLYGGLNNSHPDKVFVIASCTSSDLSTIDLCTLENAKKQAAALYNFYPQCVGHVIYRHMESNQNGYDQVASGPQSLLTLWLMVEFPRKQAAIRERVDPEDPTTAESEGL